VIISTPDHPARGSCYPRGTGKEGYLPSKNPTSLTVEEGRLLSDVVRRQKVVMQIGTQQRSSPQFRIAAELVRNGRIGRLHTVKNWIAG